MRVLRGRPRTAELRPAASSSPLRRILASPKFVFRVEPDPPARPPGATYRISDLELASRAVVLPLEQIPDDELLTLASQDKLRTPGGAREAGAAHAGRSEGRARWRRTSPASGCSCGTSQNVCPTSVEFPNFDDNLRQAFATETELFFTSIVREDRSVIDLLTADYTFVNERLAKHYGIPNVYGSQFRRVPVTDEARRGLLGPGQHPDGDVARRPARRRCCAASGSSRTSRHAASAAAAQRAAARGERRDRSPARCASRWRSTATTRRAPAATS